MSDEPAVVHPPSGVAAVNWAGVDSWLHARICWLLLGVLIGLAAGAYGTVQVFEIFGGQIPHPTPVDPNPPPGPPSPGPTPRPPAPIPTPPAPIPVAGLRVMILYESAALSTYPPAQAEILTDPGLRAYLNSVTPTGPDGKTHEYRIWDRDVNARADAKHWSDALARQHPSMPWIVVSNGKTGFEGALPGSAAEVIALVKKYEVAP